MVALLILGKNETKDNEAQLRLQGSETGLTIVFSVAPTQVLRPPHAQHVSSLLHAVVIVL